MSTTTTDEGTNCADEAGKYSLSIPIYYTVVTLGLIFLCSLIYFIQLKRDRIVFVQEGSIISFIKEYIKATWRFRSAYGVLLTQLFDQISDISVITQLYGMTMDNLDCDNINVKYLFFGSSFIYVFYHIASSILIYRYSRGNLKLAILQFFDLSFIVTLQINYRFQNVYACSPQRYIANLEATCM